MVQHFKINIVIKKKLSLKSECTASFPVLSSSALQADSLSEEYNKNMLSLYLYSICYGEWFCFASFWSPAKWDSSLWTIPNNAAVRNLDSGNLTSLKKQWHYPEKFKS